MVAIPATMAVWWSHLQPHLHHPHSRVSRADLKSVPATYVPVNTTPALGTTMINAPALNRKSAAPVARMMPVAADIIPCIVHTPSGLGVFAGGPCLMTSCAGPDEEKLLNDGTLFPDDFKADVRLASHQGTSLARPSVSHISGW